LAQRFPQLEILELIGAGGMGAVYKARQRALDRVVAVKILPPEVGADPAFAERFAREAQALARLGHQHIVSVYDFGVAGDLYYFIMEYVDGANLRQLIHAGNLNPAEALAIVPQICDALQFAHDEGVVHRDIKPENILVDKRGRVKIADFGLARLLGAGAPEVSLTGTNQVLGTLHYMAPEQIQGLRSVDHRADIYSLGVVFYEMLTGELPLGRFAPPSQKVEVDVRLDEVVLRSLESEPQRRYQQVSQIKSDVDRISQAIAEPLRSASSSTPPDSEERQREVELAEIAPGWLPFLELAIFALGWLIAGAMWNFRAPGLVVATFALAALAYVSIRWNLIYLPKLRAELERQSNARRGFAIAMGALLFLLAMMFVTGGQTSVWKLFSEGPQSNETLTDAQATLREGLRAAKVDSSNLDKLNLLELGPRSYGPAWQPLILLFVAYWLIVAAVATVIDTRRYRNSWKYCWSPALTLGTLILAPLVLLSLGFMPKGSGKIGAIEVRCEATKDQLKQIIERWSAEYGYRVRLNARGSYGGSGSRPGEPKLVEDLMVEDVAPEYKQSDKENWVTHNGEVYLVKDGKVFKRPPEDWSESLDAIEYRLDPPTDFDRFRLGRRGVYRPLPPLSVMCVTRSTSKSPQSNGTFTGTVDATTVNNAFVQIQPGWQWLESPEAELWPPILNSLESTLAATKKPQDKTPESPAKN